MAKGDDKRARQRIDQQQQVAQKSLDLTRNEQVVPQAQEMWNNYKTATDLGFKDYGHLMGGFENFQKTGGYSPQDISSIRARSVSPIRSIYANANREVDRGKALSGYSPNYNASKAKMAREQSYALSDAQTGVESNLAQMINQGKQFGLQGGVGLYGQAPGMASTFGNQALGATRNWLDAQQLQNQLSLGVMGAQTDAAKLQGKWQQGFDNVIKGGQTIAGMVPGMS